MEVVNQDIINLMLIAIVDMLQSHVIITVIIVVIDNLIGKAAQPKNWYSIPSRGKQFSLL